MSLIWIVTTGNSDVKLNSDKGWKELRIQKNDQLEPCKKHFNSLIEGDDNFFTLPARVMGILYGDTWDTHEEHFRFPLLEEFSKELIDKVGNPNRIIVLLTNQEGIFSDDDQEDPRYDRHKDSPYWRDTCCLEPIFKHYFDQKFGEGKVEFVFLEPQDRTKGLDNWDSALQLVQEKFKCIKIKQNDRVVISHQAGTAATSSAVQFSGLAQFGDKVSFLIANERDKDLTRFLESSEYLRGIRKIEAQKLLERHDYSGVKFLIFNYLHSCDKTLLDAAIQWNYAEFERFVELLEGQSISEKYPDLVQKVKAWTEEQNWWWIAYEEAYLAFVRLTRQGNTVEAFFHSFRAFEGLTSKWAAVSYPAGIEDRDGLPVATLKNSGGALPKYLLNELEKLNAEGKLPEIRLYGEPLFRLFRESRPELSSNQDLKTVWNKAKNIRNQQFHRLKGLDEKSLYQAWGQESESSWAKRVLNCLHLISESDRGSCSSLKKASLMPKVHRELERAIAAL